MIVKFVSKKPINLRLYNHAYRKGVHDAKQGKPAQLTYPKTSQREHFVWAGYHSGYRSQATGD